MTDATRSIREELDLAANPEDVFAAFTEARHLANWFAPAAESAPGPDGWIRLSWNLGGEPMHCAVTDWQPGARLGLDWIAGPDQGSHLPLTIHLERTDGGTRLTLVHEGFLSDASWDDEYQSHARGWHYELRSLRHYLEQAFGRARQVLFERGAVDGQRARAWQHLVGQHEFETRVRPWWDALQQRLGEREGAAL